MILLVLGLGGGRLGLLVVRLLLRTGCGHGTILRVEGFKKDGHSVPLGKEQRECDFDWRDRTVSWSSNRGGGVGTDGGWVWSKRPKEKKELGSPGCEVVGVWFSKNGCVLLVVVV